MIFRLLIHKKIRLFSIMLGQLKNGFALSNLFCFHFVILCMNKAFESLECFSEISKHLRCAEAVASGVVLGVYWVHDYKHLLSHRR